MYKALIVDNEPFIRIGIRDYMEWESLGIDAVYEAEDGIEALDIIEIHKPDIVITDIKMPGMDGIELVRRIHEKYGYIKTIILTGYADFSFAQAAVRYEVVDFVLKPTKLSQISSAVQKALEQIESRKETRSRIQTLESEISDSMEILRENQVRDIILNAKPPGRAEDFGLSSFVLILIETTVFNAGADAEAAGGMRIKNMADLAFHAYDHLCVPMDKNRLCLVLRLDGRDYGDEMRGILLACEEITGISETTLSISISVSISGVHHGAAELPAAYEETIKAMKNRFYEQNSICMYLPNEKTVLDGKEGAAESFIDDIVAAVSSGDNTAAVRLLFDFVRYVKRTKLAIEYVKNIAALIYSLCVKLVPVKEDEKIIDSEVYRKIFEAASVSELSSLIEAEISHICNKIQSYVENNNTIIQKTMDFISEHYRKNIRLVNIAQNAHVNESYLSHLFKKVTGETITEALTKIRINKAKELLLTTDLKSYEIAVMVGVEDAAYFSILFKKYTGFSPRHYRIENGKK